MQRKCLKCGHIKQDADGGDLEACPSCGAIYSRVEQLAAAKGIEQVRPAAREGTAAPSGGPSVPPELKIRPARQVVNMDDQFVDKMRRESLYPTFRNLVQAIYWIWVVLAIIMLVGGVLSLLLGSGLGRVMGPITGIGLSLFFFIIARTSKEVSLMLADLSDAAVRLAQKTEFKS